MHSENQSGQRKRSTLRKKTIAIGATLGVMSTLLLAAPAAFAIDERSGAMYCNSSRPVAILRTVHTGQAHEHRRNNGSGQLLNSGPAGTNKIMSTYYGTYTQGWWAWGSGAFSSVSATCNT